MNSDLTALSHRIARQFHLLSQPKRLMILLTIGEGEVCVCHLEVCLGLRQAAISQQLKSLRDSGAVTSRRSGKHIYYAIRDPHWLPIIKEAAQFAGISAVELAALTQIGKLEECNCPHCRPAFEPTRQLAEEAIPTPGNG